MTSKQTRTTWKEYLDVEIPNIKVILEERGYSLLPDQPHTKGERFLMQAMTTTGGRKIILLGTDRNGNKVVIKATSDANGKIELAHEQTCRQVLHNIDFAYDSFHSPTEKDFIKQKDYFISIQEFIEQPRAFLERPLEEQFFFSLKALKTQENARATTKKHFRKVAQIFGNRSSDDYLKLHAGFLTFLRNEQVKPAILSNVTATHEILKNNQERIEQYCGFLTHTDFVPHNFRIKDDTLYLLDFSSLQFGNKHESWARFLNFMTLYNPKLENLLIEYVEDNRSSEERESLQLMRLFRLSEIISYYVNTTNKSSDKLHDLNSARVDFWNDVLTAELKNTRVDLEIVQKYKQTRDSLRSEEEKERQVGLH